MSRTPQLIAALILALPLQYAVADDETPAPEQPAPEQPAPEPEPVTVTGKVVDKRSDEGLPAAYIQIKGAGTQTVATELDGTFVLRLPAGTYKLTFSTPEFDEQTKTIVVEDGKVVELDISMAPTVVAGKAETIEVEGTIDTRKESATLAVRQAAPTVSDSRPIPMAMSAMPGSATASPFRSPSSPCGPIVMVFAMSLVHFVP